MCDEPGDSSADRNRHVHALGQHARSHVQAERGETDSTNWLYLYDGGCNYITYLGKFKVDASGSASKIAYADVTGYGDEFFVCGYGSINEVYDCSLIAKV